ncbi:hypothetical protein AMECASPLE_009084 [Ameca splendens]|uniref:Uncharacterized protein n=1 Tax=Ameca splendens TaxID=208324 RepID=A0ABV0ZWE7_9TELE
MCTCARNSKLSSGRAPCGIQRRSATAGRGRQHGGKIGCGEEKRIQKIRTYIHTLSFVFTAQGWRGNDKRETGDNAGLAVALGPSASSKSPAARSCGPRCCHRETNDVVRLRFSGPSGWNDRPCGSHPEYQDEICCSHWTHPGRGGFQPGYCGNGA